MQSTLDTIERKRKQELNLKLQEQEFKKQRDYELSMLHKHQADKYNKAQADLASKIGSHLDTQ